MSQKMKTILKSVLVLASFALSFQASAVWLAPTASPTGNNAEPPVNVSSVLQYKEGSLVVGGFKSYATVFDGPVEINRTSTNSGLRLNTITSGNPFIDFTQDSTLKANLFWNRSQNRFVINNIGTNTTINEGSGSVGIGTATPGAKLEVAGQVKITGGTPGAGKVLTSDASGLASWQSGGGSGGVVATGMYGYAYLSGIPTVTNAYSGNTTPDTFTSCEANSPVVCKCDGYVGTGGLVGRALGVCYTNRLSGSVKSWEVSCPSGYSLKKTGMAKVDHAYSSGPPSSAVIINNQTVEAFYSCLKN